MTMRNHLAPRVSWNLFPWAIGAGMLVVVAVNIGMATSAIVTFPGKAGRDGFDLSNHYNTIMDRARDQAALGWTVAAEMDARSQPVVVLTGPDGKPLAGARIQAAARRPLGDPEEIQLTFTGVGDGRYVASTPLSARGQWELLLTVTNENHEISAARRVIVR